MTNIKINTRNSNYTGIKINDNIPKVPVSIKIGNDKIVNSPAQSGNIMDDGEF